MSIRNGHPLLVMFDLDGVLIDAWGMIRDSYRAAGVEAPPDFRTVDGRVWIKRDYPHMTAEQVAAAHHSKNVHQLRGMLDGRFTPLPPADVANVLRLGGDADVGVLTGAPHGTMNALRRWHMSSRFFPWYDGVRKPDKRRVLELIGTTVTSSTRKIYVDDQDVPVPPDWHFIRYNGESQSEFYEMLSNSQSVMR